MEVAPSFILLTLLTLLTFGTLLLLTLPILLQALYVSEQKKRNR